MTFRYYGARRVLVLAQVRRDEPWFQYPIWDHSIEQNPQAMPQIHEDLVPHYIVRKTQGRSVRTRVSTSFGLVHPARRVRPRASPLWSPNAAKVSAQIPSERSTRRARGKSGYGMSLGAPASSVQSDTSQKATPNPIALWECKRIPKNPSSSRTGTVDRRGVLDRSSGNLGEGIMITKVEWTVVRPERGHTGAQKKAEAHGAGYSRGGNVV